jgi:hypothetical protein
MSDLAALFLTSFLGVLAFLVVFYASKLANDLGDQIVLGFIGGRPVPIQQRWLMLYNSWVSFAVANVVFPTFIALACLQIADNVNDTGVKNFAYLAAAMAGFGTLMWLLQGVSTFANYRSVLRQAQAD